MAFLLPNHTTIHSHLSQYNTAVQYASILLYCYYL